MKLRQVKEVVGPLRSEYYNHVAKRPSRERNTERQAERERERERGGRYIVPKVFPRT